MYTTLLKSIFNCLESIGEKMKKSRIVAGKGVRKTALRLSQELEGMLLLKKETKFANRQGMPIVNWGATSSSFPEHLKNGDFSIINSPECVDVLSNKVKTLEAIEDLGVEYTTDRSVAENWREEGSIVIARSLVSSNSGKGIEVVLPDTFGEMPDVPLYTKYFRSFHEIRVHIGRTSDEQQPFKIIDIQRKCLRTDEQRPERLDDAGFYVRNHNNGFIFSRGDMERIPEEHLIHAKNVAANCMLRTEADFAAIDMRINRDGVVKVLEMNSAPGLSGTTLENWVTYFTELLE